MLKHKTRALDVWDKINYIHDNPVVGGLVYELSYYVYSSAIYYRGNHGLVSLEKL